MSEPTFRDKPDGDPLAGTLLHGQSSEAASWPASTSNASQDVATTQTPADEATLRKDVPSHGVERSLPPISGSLEWLKPLVDEPSSRPAAAAGGANTVRHEAADLATQDFLSKRTPPAADPEGLATTRDRPSGPARRGEKRLGRFVLVKELGAGAFGKVYLGRDPLLDRDVAIKVAKVGLWSSEEDRTRFLREARAAAQLRHPHIVPVYEFGDVGDSDYIAYQYVRGNTLRDELKRHKKLPVERAVELTIKLADALNYAHSKGIVHRDVKPENVLLDEEGQPHVADFGCARRDDPSGLLTVEGQVMGTPAYMSPEQASGLAFQADGRSDVWSLGVMLEEMLTGQRPFQGTLTEILLSIRDVEPKSIRQHDARLPRDLETICQKCLMKRPEDRFTTAGLLVEELQRFQRGEPIQSRRINVFVRTWRWARRNPTVALLLSGIVTAVLLAAAAIYANAATTLAAERDRELVRAEQVMDVQPANVSVILQAIHQSPYRDLIRERLQRHWQEKLAAAESAPELFSRPLSRAGLGLLATNPPADVAREVRRHLVQEMLQAPIDEFLAIRDGLPTQAGAEQVERKMMLWDLAQQQTAADSVDAVDANQRLKAYAALATYDPNASQWMDVAEDAVDRILGVPLIFLPQWLDAFQPVRKELLPALEVRFQDHTDSRHEVAAEAIAHLFRDDLLLIRSLLDIAQPKQLSPLILALRNQPSEARRVLREPASAMTKIADESAEMALVRAANQALARYALGEREPTIQALQSSANPSLRTEIIERLPWCGLPLPELAEPVRQLAARSDRSSDEQFELAGWIVTLGKFGRTVVTHDRREMIPWLTHLRRQNLDPGVHSAVAWTMQQWGEADALDEGLFPSPEDGGSSHDPRWLVTPSGLTMTVLGPVENVTTGSAVAEQLRFSGGLQLQEITEGEMQHQRRIPRRFALATREVTVAEFREFVAERESILRNEIEKLEKEENQAADIRALRVAIDNFRGQHDERRANEVSDSAPVRDLSWWEAVTYCRWLSDREGIPEWECCYPSVVELAVGAVRNVPPTLPGDLFQRTGYRLPTMVEWEYAARGGSETPWYWGEFETHSRHYAWSQTNSISGPHAAGLLIPNRFGLFDMSGNVAEWSQSWNASELPPNEDGVPPDDDDSEFSRYVRREVRGGSYRDSVGESRSARRNGESPLNKRENLGFRVARTVARTVRSTNSKEESAPRQKQAQPRPLGDQKNS